MEVLHLFNTDQDKALVIAEGYLQYAVVHCNEPAPLPPATCSHRGVLNTQDLTQLIKAGIYILTIL